MNAIDKYYGTGGAVEDLSNSLSVGGEMDFAEFEVVEEEDEEINENEMFNEAEQAPVVKLVNQLLAKAVIDKASDIHIEPYEKTLRIRFRIDGIFAGCSISRT